MFRGRKTLLSAINKILNNKNLWKKYSDNGIENVKRHYTWEAHTNKYLEEITKILNKGLDKENTFAPIGRKLFSAEKMIVTDIDNTLLGDDNYTREFAGLLRNKHEKVRFAVATGRTVDSALSVLKENDIPHPDVIIPSVGSEIYYNHEGKLIYSKGWEAHISNQWYPEKIFELLKKFRFLTYQEEDAQRKFKISYYMKNVKDNLDKVKGVLIDK